MAPRFDDFKSGFCFNNFMGLIKMIKTYIKKKLGLLLWIETQKMIACGNNEDIIKKITEVYASHLKPWQQFDRLLELHKKNVKITLIDKSPE